MHARATLFLGLIFLAGACSSSTFTSTGGAGTGGTGGSTGGNAGVVGVSGAGGAAASSGATGTGGAGGGSGGGAAGSVATNTPCTWGDTSCTGAEFCNGLGCGAGQCEKRPAETSSKKPVCGCDNVTYWNALVAASRGVSVKSDGECPNGQKCGVSAGSCPANTFCNKKVQDALGCALPNLSGVCWGMPSSCGGGSAIGPTTRSCGASSCTSECQLIKNEHPWYPDDTCPQ